MPDIIAEKYEVLETIGRGGMGTVYKARQTNLDRIVAIKMLSEELASDPEFRARFQQEATVVARLNHPNIVQVHDIEAHNNTFCIIMEYVDGENLQAKIDRDVTLPEREAVKIGAQVARALAYAHGKGVIHRDIKPDNIHVTPKGVAKVMDFGIARFMDSKLKTQTGISMGTPKFMSPEQVTGKNVDGQTDLYSLGVCLYYCLAGRPPFDGENAISVATRHLYEQPEPPSKLNSSISPAVEKVILHAMEKQKQNRYANGIEMAEALEATLGIKTPLRLGTEADERFAGNATLKFPAQAYGAPGTTPVPEVEAYGDGDETITPPGAEARMTPLSSRSVPELDPDFRTPRHELTSHDATRSFKRSLFIFGGLVIVAAVLLILLVVWLRRSDSSGLQPGETSARTASPVERLQAAEAEAEHFVESGQVVQARETWLKFRSQYPAVESDRVNSRIRQLEARLPLSERDVLAERRRQVGFDYLSKQQLAMAAAYLRSAAALSPEIANSAITTSTLQNLLQRSKLANTPGAGDVAAARASFESAEQALKAGGVNADTNERLITAVEADYTEPAYWVGLGDFFMRQELVDDARVMYNEALDHVSDPRQKSEISAKIRAISK